MYSMKRSYFNDQGSNDRQKIILFEAFYRQLALKCDNELKN